MSYAEMLRSRRLEKEMTLRDLSAKSDVDSAYISRVERGTIKPPQRDEILDSLHDALGLSKEESVELKNQAAIDNGLIPNSAAAVKGVPLLLRTVARKKPGEDQIRRIIDIINEEY